MKTTPPPRCQGIPDIVADKRVLVRYRDMTHVDPCPYGQACRIVTGGEGGVANVHVITVSRGGGRAAGPFNITVPESAGATMT
jgi:hypothetical protein